jgi:lysophospholipase L1-like esterase
MAALMSAAVVFLSAITYVVLGDSTAAGVGAPPDRGIVPVTAATLRENHAVTVTNVSVSGARMRDLANEQLPRAEALLPDLVLISAGANDVTHLTPIRSVRRDLLTIVQRLRRANPTVRIVLTGSPDMGSPPRIPRPLRGIAAFQTRRINQMMRDVAAREGLTFAPIAEVTGPMFRRDPSLFDSDRFHPNERGYATWIPVLNRAIAEALAGRNGAPP